MKLQNHILTAAVISGLTYYITGIRNLSAIIFLSGVLIDLDHVLDYFLHEKRIRLDIKDFFYKCDMLQIARPYMFLHSYELLLLLGVLAIFFRHYAASGLLAGFSMHLMFDIFTNRTHPLGYSLTFRFVSKFDTRIIFPVRKADRPAVSADNIE